MVGRVLARGAERSITASLTEAVSSASDVRRGWRLAQVFWDDMAVMFRGKWSREMGAKPDDTWARAMVGLDGQTVQSVVWLLRDERREWPPTALADFMILVDRVLARRLGLPDAADALAAARVGDWSVAAVYECACAVGLGRVMGSSVRGADESVQFERAWLVAWRKVVAAVQAGETGKFRRPPVRAVALPARVAVSDEDRARARPGIDALRRKFGLKAGGGVDE